MVRNRIYALWRNLHVLALAGDLWSFRVVVYHVPRTAAAGRVDILFDCGRDEVSRRGGGLLAGDITCAR